jgi:DNA sulfur modification protein DndD
MNLIKLTTTNWRNFYGEHEIFFSNEEGRHVTLIHGQNGTGKTTMINAIKWCLYRTTPDFDDEIKIDGINNVEIAHWDTWDNKIVNGKVVKTTPNDIDSVFKVELKFEHDGVEYRATREAHQKDMRGKAVAPGKDDFTLFKKDKSNSERLIEEPQSAISRILPDELSDYFFFSGETVGKILDSSVDGGNGYKNAVRDILGFTLSDAALKDLTQLLIKNTRKKNLLIQADKLTSSFGDQLISLNADKDFIEGQLSELRREFQVFDKAYEAITKEIAETGHEQEKKLGEELKEKENSRANEIIRRNGFIKEKIELIEKYGFAIFGSFLKKEVQPLKKAKFDGKLPAGVIDTFVEDLLEKHKCICTRDLIEKTAEYDAVKALLDTANTSVIDSRLTKAFNATAFFNGRANKFISDLERVSNQLDKSDSLISSYDNACVDIENTLRRFGSTDIATLLTNKRTLKNSCDEKRNEIASKTIVSNSNKVDIVKIEKSIQKIQTNNPELEMRVNFERVINITKKRLELNQGKYEKSARRQITGTVHVNMLEYSHNEFTANVDENFNVNLTVSGTNTIAAGAGKGTEMLSKLSFITALISFSKLRKNAESAWAAPGTIAPFVIDAPFSEMDEDYQKSTLKFLPAQSHQLIIFLSNGQWREHYEEVIGNYIGKRYYYKNHIKPGGNLTQSKLPINGEEYEVEVDDWDKPHFGTTIVEIK